MKRYTRMMMKNEQKTKQNTTERILRECLFVFNSVPAISYQIGKRKDNTFELALKISQHLKDW